MGKNGLPVLFSFWFAPLARGARLQAAVQISARYHGNPTSWNNRVLPVGATQVRGLERRARPARSATLPSAPAIDGVRTAGSREAETASRRRSRASATSSDSERCAFSSP